MATGLSFLMVTLMVLAGVMAVVMLGVFVLLPAFRGIGWCIANFFKCVGWFFAHIFEFIGGMLGDTLRFIGALLAMVVLAPMSVLNVIIGRWSAAAHFADSVKREFAVSGACLYRVLVRRPLKLFWLHGLLEGLEQRVPEAMYASPGTDKPRDRSLQFAGYTIVGSLAGGGSGGKLYIARPDDDKRRKLIGQPDHVVIKSFTLSEGSSLPQIVRESRALECAKQLGHVLDHSMDEHRFYYVMPYHPGEHLGIITRQLHGESDGTLGRSQLSQVTGYITDLLATLSLYHEGGLWHKDVKPENIIVHDGRAHLVDLGLVTPLKSAMTLTTHGTEYFRDPEMVRQALRGVKVHQVDGARFDIYAVGAVLYYMIENTFPAHGGLSRFSKKSPEALRWIVRRAMAEYNQRYTSAAMMLADIKAVAAAGDPFAFKPADLPSMRSGDQAEAMAVDVELDSPQAAQVSAAGTARPHEPAAGWASLGTLGGGDTARRAKRPKLRITNWWTGRYAVDQDGGDGGSFSRRARTAPPRMPGGGRASAREQLKSARGRAAQLQRQAHARRHKVGLERQPSPMVGFLVVLFLIIAGLIAFPLVSHRWSSVPSQAEAFATAASGSAGMAASQDVDLGKPVLLVLEGDADETRGKLAVQAVIDRYETRGYHVVHNVALPQADVRELFQTWQRGTSTAVDARFEDVLAEHDLYGFLHIKVKTTDGSPVVSETLIRSGRADAQNRRRPDDAPARIVTAPSQPYILINDHPAKADGRVSQRIAEIVESYRTRGWEITIDELAEADVRRALPVAVTDDLELSPRLTQTLHERELGGIVYIDAQPGEGESHQRIRVIELAAVPAQQNAQEAAP